MSVWNRLFGRSESSRSVCKPAPLGARLRVESLESREVPAIVFVGGWGASSYQYAFGGSAEAAAPVPALTAEGDAPSAMPTDQLSINFAKIEYATTGMGASGPGAPPPASDYLLVLDGIAGESRDDARKGTIEIESGSPGAAPVGSAAPSGDDVVVDGRIITGESADGPTVGNHGYIRIKKLNSGG